MRSARSKSAPDRRLASGRDGRGATGGQREGRSIIVEQGRGGSTRNNDLALFKGRTLRVR